MKKKVAFLGSKQIGLECLKILYKKQKQLNFEIIGVLTNKRGNDILKFCSSSNIKILNGLNDYLALEKVDIAISIQYHEILKKQHIEKAREIIVNLHMAPLPEYRGCNQFSFAIVDKATEFGTTIHKLEEGIDSGGIINERRFKINQNIWVEDLYIKTFEESILLFKETLPKLISGKYNVIPQKDYLKFRSTSLHFRGEIYDLKQIDLSWDKDIIEKHIRATYMPGFELPFTYVGNKKVYFKLSE